MPKERENTELKKDTCEESKIEITAQKMFQSTPGIKPGISASVGKHSTHMPALLQLQPLHFASDSRSCYRHLDIFLTDRTKQKKRKT